MAIASKNKTPWDSIAVAFGLPTTSTPPCPMTSSKRSMTEKFPSQSPSGASAKEVPTGYDGLAVERGPTENIAPAGLEVLKRGGEDIDLSAVSPWEVASKAKIGKFNLPQAPGPYVRRRMATQSIRPLSITQDHTLKVYDLALHHAGRFDRRFLAKGILEKMTILTADRISKSIRWRFCGAENSGS